MMADLLIAARPYMNFPMFLSPCREWDTAWSFPPHLQRAPYAMGNPKKSNAQILHSRIRRDERGPETTKLYVSFST